METRPSTRVPRRHPHPSHPRPIPATHPHARRRAEDFRNSFRGQGIKRLHALSRYGGFWLPCAPPRSSFNPSLCAHRAPVTQPPVVSTHMFGHKTSHSLRIFSAANSLEIRGAVSLSHTRPPVIPDPSEIPIPQPHVPSRKKLFLFVSSVAKTALARQHRCRECRSASFTGQSHTPPPSPAAASSARQKFREVAINVRSPSSIAPARTPHKAARDPPPRTVSRNSARPHSAKPPHLRPPRGTSLHHGTRAPSTADARILDMHHAVPLQQQNPVHLVATLFLHRRGFRARLKNGTV